CQSYIRSPLTF
nr:immunoglobulin light chain junction region [Macaca mulatta]